MRFKRLASARVCCSCHWALPFALRAGSHRKHSTASRKGVHYLFDGHTLSFGQFAQRNGQRAQV